MDETIALGPFEVGPCIGRGGTGKVFRAVHIDTTTPVAVKVIAGDGDQSSRRAFHREVQAHAGLVHPGIVYLFDYGTIDDEAAQNSGGVLPAGDSYVAMELADRGTVADHMPYGDWRSMRRLLLQVLDALAHAHAREVIHRDLKPENLLLFDGAGEDGPQLKLADFGLAHALEEVTERDERSLAQFSGTPHYMAPEQIRSQWRRYGPWTDLYALGCVAWHLVCGRPPYTGETVFAVAMKHCDDDFPGLEPRFAIPDGVEAWIRRAMATDPAARFQCAADAIRALPGAAVAQKTANQHAGARDDAVDVTAPTIPYSPPVDPAVAETIVKEPETQSTDPPARLGNTHEANHWPSVPPSWRPPDRDQLPAALVGAGLGLFGLREVPLVDRDEERDLIWQTLGKVVENRCLRVVFIAGEAGVGKSRLARWMATRTHEVGAAQVYRAIFAPGTRKAAAGLAGMIQSAFHTWKLGRGELYEELCERLPRLRKADDAVETDARALTELVSPSTDGGQVDGPRFRFASSDQKHILMARVLARLGRRRPPLLWLDDLHQNTDAVGLIEHLVTSNDPPTGLILATVRSDILADNPKLDQRIANLADNDICDHLELGPIGAVDHRELVDRLLPLTPEFGDRLAERTEGNPLFAHQLLGDLIASGSIETRPAGFQIAEGASPPVPHDIHQMWTGRIARLVGQFSSEQAEVAQEAIELAAALGREVATVEWRAVCADADLEVPDRLVDDLVERGLASRTDDGWSFAHGLLVDSIGRKSAEAGRWAKHHRRCAKALEQRSPAKTGETARRRADHWLAAGEDERALQPLLQAARHHRITGDLDSASSLCDLHDEVRRRLGLGDDDRRTFCAWLERARVAKRLGDLEKVERLHERCVKTSRRHGWDDLLAETSLDYAHLASLRGDVESGLAIGQRALKLFDTLDNQLGTARILRQLGQLQRRRGNRRQAHRNFREATRLTRKLKDPREHAISLQALSIAHQDRHEYDLAITRLSSACEIFEEFGDPLFISVCFSDLGENYKFQGDLTRAEDYYRQALERRIRAGILQNRHVYHGNLGILFSMQGKYAAAMEHFGCAYEIAAEQNLSGWVGIVHALSAFAVAGLSDWEEFDHHLSRAREHLEKWPIFDRDIAECCAEAGRLAGEAGEIERAKKAYHMAREQWAELDKPDEISAIDARLESLDG